MGFHCSCTVTSTLMGPQIRGWLLKYIVKEKSNRRKKQAMLVFHKVGPTHTTPFIAKRRRAANPNPLWQSTPLSNSAPLVGSWDPYSSDFFFYLFSVIVLIFFLFFLNFCWLWCVMVLFGFDKSKAYETSNSLTLKQSSRGLRWRSIMNLVCL